MTHSWYCMSLSSSYCIFTFVSEFFCDLKLDSFTCWLFFLILWIFLKKLWLNVKVPPKPLQFGYQRLILLLNAIREPAVGFGWLRLWPRLCQLVNKERAVSDIVESKQCPSAFNIHHDQTIAIGWSSTNLNTMEQTSVNCYVSYA